MVRILKAISEIAFIFLCCVNFTKEMNVLSIAFDNLNYS